MSTDLAAVEVLQLAIVTLGLGVLVTGIVRKVRGRNPLPQGPAPVAGFGPVDAAIGLLLWLSVQVLVGSTANAAGMEPGPDLSLVVKAAELVACALIALAWLSRNPEHGPRLKGAGWGLVLCVAALPVVWAVLVAWHAIYQAAGWGWEEQQILKDLREVAAWKFALLAIVLAPITEEVVFRGVIHLSVKRHAGRWAGILTSAGLFTLVHWSIPVAPALFVLGIALALTYEWTGTLVAPIVFHGLFNAITFVGEILKGGGWS